MPYHFKRPRPTRNLFEMKHTLAVWASFGATILGAVLLTAILLGILYVAAGL